MLIVSNALASLPREGYRKGGDPDSWRGSKLFFLLRGCVFMHFAHVVVWVAYEQLIVVAGLVVESVGREE